MGIVCGCTNAKCGSQDGIRDDDLPEEVRVLLQKIPREIGGLELLGAAAQGEWCGNWTGTGDWKRHADYAHDEKTWEGTSAHPKNPWIAPAG